MVVKEGVVYNSSSSINNNNNNNIDVDQAAAILKMLKLGERTVCEKESE